MASKKSNPNALIVIKCNKCRGEIKRYLEVIEKEKRDEVYKCVDCGHELFRKRLREKKK